MGLLDGLLSRLGYFKASRPIPDEFSDLAEGYRWSMPSATVAERQANLYANLTWISTAVDRTADIAVTAPYSVRRVIGGPDGDEEDLPNHPYELLLRRPNPLQSGGEFLRDAFSWFKVTGNLYTYKNTPDEMTPPDEMWNVPSMMIEPIPDGANYVRGYKFTPPGQASIEIPPWKIVHTKTYNPLNPFVGLSAIQSLALDAYADIAQQKWNLSLFDKSAGKFPGILAFKHMIAQPEWEKIVAERDRNWGGTNRPPVMMLRGVGDTVQWQIGRASCRARG